MVAGMLAVAWAVASGIVGYLATRLACSVGGSDGGHALGLFFLGPLGMVLGFVAAERALDAADRLGARAFGWLLLATLAYAGVVFVAVVASVEPSGARP